MNDNNKQSGTRINKFISDYGFCSRREADRLIADGRVTINNIPANPGDRVEENDKVRIDGEPLYFVPLENRPKKHRWGPAKGEATTEENTAPKRSGNRGAARQHSVNARTTTSAARPTKRTVQSSMNTSKAKSHQTIVSHNTQKQINASNKVAMPIKVPTSFPAISALQGENICLSDFPSAFINAARNVRLLVLNLMPLKIDTEINLLRVLSNSMLSIEIDWIVPQGHLSKNTSAEHIKSSTNISST